MSNSNDFSIEWLSSLEFINNVSGDSSQIFFTIYKKDAILRDFGHSWILYMKLNVDYKQMDTARLNKLCSILTAGKEYRHMGVYLSNNNCFLCRSYLKNGNHRSHISLIIMQHTFAVLLDKNFAKIDDEESHSHSSYSNIINLA
ncbi:Type III secretion system protein SepD [Edwardsiella anguillarum]|uniref:SepD n=1 Tax=Edwardsiella TaxID=635 RepID=UPI00045D2FEE|nr:SepD [Edwardsiella anguillarum]AJK93302.1 SepD [Edwardsiella sp. EA181011]GAJ68494.1 T3SS secretion switching protein SepD [Edwardsiella piscicida]BET82107.1 Type III secretion system protein SepD [Edwardsiella anguillarum]BET85536.1 Type III secretion system protein SepD [Edwardsiella anguillarum]BET88899.1 Type III secretion system protein SepD [Edwardsiella anguillarum]